MPSVVIFLVVVYVDGLKLMTLNKYLIRRGRKFEIRSTKAKTNSNHKNLNEELLKHFARLQTKDDQVCIVLTQVFLSTSEF